MNLSQASIADLVAQLESSTDSTRSASASEIFRRGRDTAEHAIARWRADSHISQLLSHEATVGVAVAPPRFARIRAVLHNPPLADVPPDQDAQEFEWSPEQNIHLDILTPRTSDAHGAIAKFLARFGEGIQQVEFITSDLGRTTALLDARLGVKPIYPAARAGADHTLVNFFLVSTPDDEKILVELVEQKK